MPRGTGRSSSRRERRAHEHRCPPVPESPAVVSRRLPGALSAPPVLTGLARSISQASQAAFRYANRWFVVPLHRAGLAAWLCGPLGGWQCLVTTIGRTSGLRRDTPLGYIVMDGAAWVMAGYGPRTQWYRNMLAELARRPSPAGQAPVRRAGRGGARTRDPGARHPAPVPFDGPAGRDDRLRPGDLDRRTHPATASPGCRSAHRPGRRPRPGAAGPRIPVGEAGLRRHAVMTERQLEHQLR